MRLRESPRDFLAGRGRLVTGWVGQDPAPQLLDPPTRERSSSVGGALLDGPSRPRWGPDTWGKSKMYSKFRLYS